MKGNQATCDGEPEAGAFGLCRRFTERTLERLEHAFQRIRRDSDAGIGDQDG